MNRLIEFMRKHCIITAFLGGIGVILIIKLGILILKKMIVFMIVKTRIAFCYIISRQFAAKMMQYSNISANKWLNVIFCYLELCMGFVVIWVLVTMFMAVISVIVEKTFDVLRTIVLGRNHERSLQYNVFQVWFLKVHTDLNMLMFWIKFNICGVRYSQESHISVVKKAKMFTVENIFSIIKNCFRFFFCFSIVHILFAIYSIYIFYAELLQDFFVSFWENITGSSFSISNVIDYFELISIILLLGYIFLDVRHKANGYSEIRTERFKKLVEMEEKLLNILQNINYALETNIEVIVDRKPYILKAGAENLTGKECYIYDGIIKYEDKKYWKNCISDDVYFQFRNLKEMGEEFNKLTELDEEFKQSSLSYSNIFMIDHQAMLTKLVYFLGCDNLEYKKMKFFCKSSMENWFKNRFIKPITVGCEEEYYAEERAKKVILDASAALDFELMNAFELEVHLKRYERKMIKRIKKINNFSRFNLN